MSEASTPSEAATTTTRGVSLELDGADPPQQASSSSTAAAELDLKVARRLFYGGFAGLPWLWFVSWVHFRKTARLPQADPQLQTYVQRSLVGTISGAVLLVAWILYVQLSWRTWSPSVQAAWMLVLPEDAEDL